MKEKIPAFFASALSVMLLPYLFTILINGLETGLMNRPLDVEACLPQIVSKQIPSDYELESVKAQAVIARSNLCRRLREETELTGILGILCESMDISAGSWELPDKIYDQAVRETKGQVLLYEGELKLVPYHEISAGRTRSGEEAFHEEAYSYLKAVDSSVDKESADYLSSTYLSQQQMPKELEVLETDSARYVVSLLADGRRLEGEAFRQSAGLASPNFTIQKVGNEYRFLCKGKGHGVGFSQNGGNELAKGGAAYGEILETYFPAMELDDINDIFYVVRTDPAQAGA